MAVTGNWQVEYAGLAMGPDTPYELVAPIEGISDHPEVRTSDAVRLRAHGLLPGDDFLDGRSVTLRLEIGATSDTALSNAIAVMKAALAPAGLETPLVFQIPGVAGGGVRRINARPRKLALPIDTEHYFRLATATVAFDATDPRIYDETVTTLTTGLAASPPGLAWSLTWNLNWGGASMGNAVAASNAGTFATPWAARIDGPVTNPGIENMSTGQVLSLAGDAGLVLGLGEYVEMDSTTRTVLLGGTASRYSKLTANSSWWDLPPGATTLRFLGTTSGSPQLAVSFRSAWI